MEITKANPDDFINSLTDEQRPDIDKLDKLITKALPKVRRVMWEGKFWGGSEQKIIGYGEFAFVGSNKKVGDWFLVGLAQQKNYITVFVIGFDNQKYIAEQYKGKFGKAKVGKSTISFKTLSDIDTDVLEDLIKKAYQLHKANPVYHPKSTKA